MAAAADSKGGSSPASASASASPSTLPLFIGIDLGLQNTRIAVADATGFAMHTLTDDMMHHSLFTSTGVIEILSGKEAGKVIAVHGNEARNLAFKHQVATRLFDYKAPATINLQQGQQLQAFFTFLYELILDKHSGCHIAAVAITVPPAVDNCDLRLQLRENCDPRKLSDLAAKVSNRSLLQASSVQLIHSAVAAATSYYFDTHSRTANNTTGERNVLVVEFGAGCASTMWLTLDGGIVEVKAVQGATIGGDNIDSVILNYCLQQRSVGSSNGISREHKARLRVAAELAKIQLLSSREPQTVKVSLDGTAAEGGREGGGGGGQVVEISTAWLINAMKPITTKFLELLQRASTYSFDHPQQGRVTRQVVGEIDEVVFAGGGIRKCLLFQDAVKSIFNKANTFSVLDAQAAACGACTRAFIYGGCRSVITNEFLVLDVISRSIGILVQKDPQTFAFTEIIRQATTIPAKKSQVYRSSGGNLNVLVAESRCIGSGGWTVVGLVTLLCVPQGSQVQVTIDVDSHAIGNVTVEVVGNSSLRHRKQFGDKLLTKDEIEEMCSSAESTPLVEIPVVQK